MDLINNDVLPTLEQHKARIAAVLSDNGREFCGRPVRHPYELLLQLEEIEHRTALVQRPQSNSFVERLHLTLLDEHFRVTRGKKWYETIEEMQADLDAYLAHYNHKQPQQGRVMESRTPYKAFMAGLPKKENAKMKPTKKAA